ncbi:MAG: phage tail tape measure protein [Lachnospiraceae bacterium]|nr:phage tail tape measure protein [Lachnospiraceae bacterium]
MAKKISVKMYLDGASQFNSDIKKINDNLKLLGSEMKTNQEIFKTSQNSAEALRAKSETLNKQYEQAEKKVKAYSDRLQEVQKAREKANSDLTKYTESLSKEEAKLQEIEKTQGKTSEAYAQQKQKVDELQKSVEQTTNVVGQLDTKEIQLQTSLNNATTEQVKYGSELAQTNKYLEEAEKSTDKCAKSIDEFGKKTDEAEKHGEKLSDTLSQMAQNEAMEKLGEAAKKLLENLIECAETAEKFEYSIAKVQSIAQVSESDLRGMSEGIRQVGQEMGYGANEIAEATYQAISASVDASEAVGFVEDATKLARAGFTESATSVDVLTTAINAYGKEANTSKHIADDLITTQNLGKTTVAELAQSMGTVIPTASALGVSLDQLSSMYVLMTKQGINTANATTYIRAMMNELSDSGSDLSDTLGNLTGHTFGELMSMGYTVGDVMQILGDSVDGNSEAFKNLFSNVRAGLGGLSLFNQGADAFNDAMVAMQTNTGATDKAFQTMANTAEMTNQRLTVSVENFKIAVGEALSPALDEFKEGGIGILETITNIAKENPTLVSALAGAAAGIATLATVVTGAAVAIGILRLAFGDAVGAATVFAAVGVAAAVGAIGGIATSAISAANEVDEVTQAMQESAQEVEDIHHEVQGFLVDFYKGTSSKHIDNLIDRINELNKVEDLSVYQRKELKDATRDLNDMLGEEVVTLNKETGHLTDLTDEWIKNATAKKEALASSGLEEKYNEVIQKRTEVEAELWEVEDKIKDLQAETVISLTDLEGKTKDVVAGEEAQKEALGELLARRAELNGQNIRLTEDEERLKNAMDESKAAVDEAAKAAGEYTDSLGVVHDSALGVKDAEDDLETAMSNANQAISSQIGLFDEWNQKSDLTLEKMEQRWKDQTKGVNQYSEDLAYLKRVIEGETDPAIKDLASEMANMGVDGAAEIHNFVEGLKQIGDNKDKVKELAQTWQEHIDAIKSAEDLYASIEMQEKGYTEDSEALFERYYTNSKRSREDYNKEIVLLTETGVKDQAKAVEDNAPEVENATQAMMDNSFQKACDSIGLPAAGGTSTKYVQMGQDIIASIASGIEAGDKAGTVGNALTNALQNATNRIDVSSVAANINRKLGEEVNRQSSR